MKISQYVYFAITTETVAPREITVAVGIEPDHVKVRGSRSLKPKVMPPQNSWQIRSDSNGLTVDEHFAKVVARLMPAKQRLREFLNTTACSKARFQVVRNFADPDGEEEQECDDPRYGRKLAGQHQLLGWHLEREIVDLIVYLDASFDVDEYG